MTAEAGSYLTIAAPCEGLYKEKGSKFFAFAYPVSREEGVKVRLNELRKQYHDARHHCYAYILGPDRNHYRANDDGEPNHSAGDPILGQINSKELTNVLLVVVRYFGGTKLGVSGLINAYKTAAGEALRKATILQLDVTTSIRLKYAYDTTNEVMRLVSDYHITIKDQTFETACELEGEVKVTLTEQLIEKVQLLKDTGHQVELMIGD